MDDVGRHLEAIEKGDPKAGEELLPLVYEELRKLAAQKLAREAAGSTLQPTALVHEAWCRLGDGTQPKWENRRHFFAAAAEAMRRILIDRARRRQVRSEAGLAMTGDWSESQLPGEAPDEELLTVHAALDELAAVDADAADLVKLRYFVGMSMPEAAEAAGLPLRSAERLWAFGRAWLRQALESK